MTNPCVQQAIPSSETDLVESLKSGDSASFEFLVREYGGYMLTIARRYFNNEADAQDSVQDAYIQAFRSIQQFEERSTLKSWLHRIVVNACLMRLRSSKRRSEEFIDDNDSLFDDHGKRLEQANEIEMSVESLLIDKETQTLVKSYINKLPPNYRNLLLLRDIEGYSTVEAAKLLDISNASVKTGLHRARSALKNSLTDHPW